MSNKHRKGGFADIPGRILRVGVSYSADCGQLAVWECKWHVGCQAAYVAENRHPWAVNEQQRELVGTNIEAPAIRNPATGAIVKPLHLGGRGACI